jgi:HEAT repeat protein
LRSWYEYIAGVVARDRIVHLYDDLNSGRLPHPSGAEVTRFRPILHGTSTDEQQRVLGVLGRRYHADFRAALRDALRNKNSFIRAQAAAVASRLDAEEKNKLWSSASPADTPDAP